MFLGNLSTNTERKARKPKADKAKDELKSLNHESQVHSSLKRLPSGSKEILYTKVNGDIPRDVLLDYLKSCIVMLMDEINMKEIIRDSINRKVGLQAAEIEFQRDVLEFNFQIERDYGCFYLGTITERLADDIEVINAAKDFMLGCMGAYLKAIKLRSKLYLSGQFPGPSANESMSRNSILEFFEACNALMELPETKKELREIYSTTQKIPNERVIEMQRNILKLLGYNPDFAVSCLNRVGVDFKEDREIAMKMRYFALGAELACHEARLTEEEREKYYASIPPMFHHCPQVHVMKQRMMQANQMAADQQRNAASNTLTSEEKAKDLHALQSTGLFHFVSTPEGKTTLQQLSLKISKSRERVEEGVKEWDNEKMTQQFDSFLDHPLVQTFSNSPMNDRMNVLSELSDEDLDSVMRVVTILSTNNNKLLSKLRNEAFSSTPEGEHPKVQVADESKAVMHGIILACNSLDTAKQMKRFQAAPSSNQHLNQHYSGQQGRDVAIGNSNSMER